MFKSYLCRDSFADFPCRESNHPDIQNSRGYPWINTFSFAVALQKLERHLRGIHYSIWIHYIVFLHYDKWLSGTLLFNDYFWADICYGIASVTNNDGTMIRKRYTTFPQRHFLSNLSQAELFKFFWHKPMQELRWRTAALYWRIGANAETVTDF